MVGIENESVELTKSVASTDKYKPLQIQVRRGFFIGHNRSKRAREVIVPLQNKY